MAISLNKNLAKYREASNPIPDLNPPFHLLRLIENIIHPIALNLNWFIASSFQSPVIFFKRHHIRLDSLDPVQIIQTVGILASEAESYVKRLLEN